MDLSMSIPINDLGTSVKIFVPFTFSVPGLASRSDEQEYDNGGRSFSGEVGHPGRLNMYKQMEQYVEQIVKGDGHSCLLRAMCEVSANPQHEDGLMGECDLSVV